MAERRRRVVTTTETDELPRAQPEPIPGISPADPASQDIDEAIRELGLSSARAQVNRLDETTGRIVRLCSLETTQVSQEFIQANFGGGRYQVQFRKPDGTLTRRVHFDIDRRIPSKIPAWLLGGDAPVTATPAAPARPKEGEDDDADFKHLYRLKMLDLIKRSDELSARASEMQAQTSQMQMTMMKTMMESVSGLLANVNKPQAGAPAPMSFADIIKLQGDAKKETLELVKELRGGNTEAGTIDRAIGLMGKLSEARERFADAEPAAAAGGPFDSIIGELAKVLIPLLTPALIARFVPGAAALAASPPAAAASPAALPAASPVPSSPPAPAPMPSMLQMAMQSLYEAAQRGDDPKDKAVSIMDMCPGAYVGKLREEMMSPDVVERVIADTPAFGEYRNWLTELVTALRTEFAGADAAPGTPSDN